MANVYLQDSTLTSIGDAIRSKNGLTTKYKPGEMPAAIKAIEGGGSSTTSDISKINVMWERTAQSNDSSSFEDFLSAHTSTQMTVGDRVVVVFRWSTAPASATSPKLRVTSYILDTDTISAFAEYQQIWDLSNNSKQGVEFNNTNYYVKPTWTYSPSNSSGHLFTANGTTSPWPDPTYPNAPWYVVCDVIESSSIGAIGPTSINGRTIVIEHVVTQEEIDLAQDYTNTRGHYQGSLFYKIETYGGSTSSKSTMNCFILKNTDPTQHMTYVRHAGVVTKDDALANAIHAPFSKNQLILPRTFLGTNNMAGLNFLGSPASFFSSTNAEQYSDIYSANRAFVPMFFKQDGYLNIPNLGWDSSVSCYIFNVPEAS